MIWRVRSWMNARWRGNWQRLWALLTSYKHRTPVKKILIQKQFCLKTWEKKITAKPGKLLSQKRIICYSPTHQTCYQMRTARVAKRRIQMRPQELMLYLSRIQRQLQIAEEVQWWMHSCPILLTQRQSYLPTSAPNKSSGSLFINFGGTCVYTADMNTFNANKLAASGPINLLRCREVCLSNAQRTTRYGQNIFLSTGQLGIINSHNYSNQHITDELLCGMNLTCYDDSEESKRTFLNTLIQLKFIGFNSNAFMIDENCLDPPEQNGIHYSVIYVEVYKKPLSTDISINKYSLDTCQSKMNLNADKLVLQSIVRLFDQSLNQMEDYNLITTSTHAPINLPMTLLIRLHSSTLTNHHSIKMTDGDAGFYASCLLSRLSG